MSELLSLHLLHVELFLRFIFASAGVILVIFLVFYSPVTNTVLSQHDVLGKLIIATIIASLFHPHIADASCTNWSVREYVCDDVMQSYPPLIMQLLAHYYYCVDK